MDDQPSLSSDLHALIKAGASALQNSDLAGARRYFERVVASGTVTSSVLVALATACQGLKDFDAMLRALDQALALEPANLPALVMKGDYLAATGRDRAAIQFYDVAIALGAKLSRPTTQTAEVLKRIEAERNRIKADITAHLHKELAAFGYDERVSSSRFTHAVELLTGKKQRYQEHPRAFFFPELPTIQFYPREAFPWLDAIEGATREIRDELYEVLQDEDAFVPYVRPLMDAPTDVRHHSLNSRDWTAFFLWKDGVACPAEAARCPRTIAALQSAPLVRIKGRSPSILFSRLRSGARIAPHTGFINTRLICHLPLLAPPHCSLRVGNDQRVWEDGKALVFNDTIEHEARNESSCDRVVLIFEIWRPELSQHERDLVTKLMEAVDTYGGVTAPWTA